MLLDVSAAVMDTSSRLTDVTFGSSLPPSPPSIEHRVHETGHRTSLVAYPPWHL